MVLSLKALVLAFLGIGLLSTLGHVAFFTYSLFFTNFNENQVLFSLLFLKFSQIKETTAIKSSI
jgi:hypothetical protein